MFAKQTAAVTPIAVPISCRKSSSLKRNTLVLITVSRRVMMRVRRSSEKFLSKGFMKSWQACMPSLIGMLGYKASTSAVLRAMSGDWWVFCSILLMRVRLSGRIHGIFATAGPR